MTLCCVGQVIAAIHKRSDELEQRLQAAKEKRLYLEEEQRQQAMLVYVHVLSCLNCSTKSEQVFCCASCRAASSRALAAQRAHAREQLQRAQTWYDLHGLASVGSELGVRRPGSTQKAGAAHESIRRYRLLLTAFACKLFSIH